MDWSQYAYLAGIAVAALVLLILATRLVPDLRRPRKTRRRPLGELVLLGCVLLLGIATIYWKCFSGPQWFGYNDVGSDTVQQYVPYYIDMVNAIKNGTWGYWDFTFGLGSSFMAYSAWAFDPFDVIVIPLTMLLGTPRLGLILVTTQAVKIVLSGFLFDHLLTFFCRAPLSRVLGGSLFAFGGWLLLWGQHYWLGAVYVASVLLVLLVELLMERWSTPRFLGLTATTAVSILMGVYSGFMSLLFAAIYALLRSIHVSQCTSFGQFLRFFGKLALPVVCGILIGCIRIVPYCYLILHDMTRVTNAGGMSTPQRIQSYLQGFVPLSWLPLMASRLLGNSLVYTGNVFDEYAATVSVDRQYLLNSYEFLMVGAGGATLMLGSQCLSSVYTKGTRRDKVLVTITCLLVVLFCVNEFLPALFSAFNLKYRASFVLLFPLCIACAVGWEKVMTDHEVHKVSLAVSAALTYVIICWSLASTKNGRLVCLFFLVAVTVFLLAFCLGTRGPASRKTPTSKALLVALACAAAISTSVVDGFFATNARDLATTNNLPTATDLDSDTLAALEYLKSNDQDFYRIGKLYGNWTTVDDSLIQGYSSVSIYNSVQDSDVIEFYQKEWPEIVTAGGAVQDFALDPFEPALTRLLGVRYILSDQPLDIEWLGLINQFGNVYVYEDTRVPSIGSSSFIYEGESEADAASLEDRRSLVGGTVVVPDDVASTLQLAPVDSSVIRSQEPSEFHLTSGSSLEGTMDALAESVACLSIPHTSGWTVTVDGNEVDTFRANYGFIGFVLPAGSHHITASYVPVGQNLGRGIAIAGAVLAAVSCLVGTRHRRQVQDNSHGRHFTKTS